MAYFIPALMKYKEAKTPEERAAVLNDSNYCLTKKMDGASYVLAKDENGEIHFYSGGISKKDGLPIDKINNVPHLKEWAQIYMPLQSQIVGEVLSFYDFTAGEYTEHSASKRVTSIMGCNAEKAIERQKMIGRVPFYMFDIIFWNGDEIYKKDFKERHSLLDKIYQDFVEDITIYQDAEYKLPEKWTDKMGALIQISEIYTENKEEILSDWFANGEEGCVAMRLTTDGKKGADYVTREIGNPSLRRDNGVKIKTMSTYDVVVTGIEYPTKEYNGKCPDSYEYRDEEGNPVNRLWAIGAANAFAIGYWRDGEHVTIGTVASGLTDELRIDMAENPDDYIGAVIEVRCMSVDKENMTLRHPVFLQIRENKLESECTKETIF